MSENIFETNPDRRQRLKVAKVALFMGLVDTDPASLSRPEAAALAALSRDPEVVVELTRASQDLYERLPKPHLADE